MTLDRPLLLWQGTIFLPEDRRQELTPPRDISTHSEITRLSIPPYLADTLLKHIVASDASVI